MAAELSSMRKRKQGGIMTHLSSAACEWFLMFLLFVDAAFSYFLKKFAKYCELQTPCYVCSRLDHVFGEKKRGCSWTLLCSSHKEEISSLLFCSLRGELADFRVMCEECCESIAMQNRFLGRRTCLCCNKALLATKSDDESLLRLNVEPSLSHVRGYRSFNRRDGMKRLRDKLAASVIRRTTGKNGGDRNMSSIRNNHTKLERGVEFGGKQNLRIGVSSVFSVRKDQPGLLDLNELKTVNPSLSDAVTGHASREYSLAESQPKESPHLTKDSTSLDPVPQPLDVGFLDASAESSSVSSDSICIVPSSSSTVRITKKSIYIEETSKRVNISNPMNVEEATDGTSSDDSTCSSYSYSRNLEDPKCTSRASNSEVVLSLKDSSPVPHNEHEKSKKDEDFSDDSSYESLDGLRVIDVAGESIGDQLRRQVEHYRRIMESLYKELEEERNAADVAIDQAMAMITRLQKEKAEIEMVAMQYMLLMEIQAEYDVESLERDLSKKEKEFQKFQTELEFYRNNFCNGSGLEDLCEETSVVESDAATGTSGDSVSANFSKANGRFDPSVSHSLKKLVKNLYKDYCSDNVEDFEHNGSSVSKGNPARCYKSKLYDKVVETGPDSIKYSSNIRRNEEDGLQLVQDIAHQLQKLQ